MKKMKFEFAPRDKIDDFAHELIKEVFAIEGALMTNESTLDDFESFGVQKSRESLLAKVERKYKISLENYPQNEPLYVWKVARLVKTRLKES